MATSPDHPGLPFVQAAGYTQGRPDGPPLWIVVHDMEAGEHSLRAENTAAYFANPGDGRAVSSHYCVDDNSVVQCVRLADVAWTVGNRPGNNRGINWELSGFARQSRAEWLDPFGLAMFTQMAPYVRSDAQRFGIPLRKLTVAELRAYAPGVTSHNDLRLAFGVTDHTDPGPDFPWDYFIAAMTGGAPPTTVEDDMWTIVAPSKTVYLVPGDLVDSRPVAIPQSGVNLSKLQSMKANGVREVSSTVEPKAPQWFVTAVDALWPPPEPPVEYELSEEDKADLAAQLAELVPSAQEVADAVVDEEHARLAE